MLCFKVLKPVDTIYNYVISKGYLKFLTVKIYVSKIQLNTNIYL